jgi:predicted nucleic acid-binding protein
MVKIVIDTSILIDHLKEKSDHFMQLEKKRLLGEVEIIIPAIVVVELYAGEDARQRKAREIIFKTIKSLFFVDVNQRSAEKAGELMRIYKQIPGPSDLIIAAIAIEHKAHIATHNKKHFEQIKEVKLFDFTQIDRKN